MLPPSSYTIDRHPRKADPKERYRRWLRHGGNIAGTNCQRIDGADLNVRVLGAVEEGEVPGRAWY